MRKTFKLVMTIVTTNDKAEEYIRSMQKDVASGKLQREFTDEYGMKVKVTLEEEVKK